MLNNNHASPPMYIIGRLFDIEENAGGKMARSKVEIDKPKSEKVEPFKWQFKPRFRRQAFGWKSQPAITRIKEAVAEIKKVSKKDPNLAAEGAVIFIERLVPAIEQVDGSSGSIGTAVNNAIKTLSPIIAIALAKETQRDDWLERLFNAAQDDGYGYLDDLVDYWGDFCASKEKASQWADDLIDIVRSSWSSDPKLRGYFKGAPACLSALCKAERYEELLKLLELDTIKFWHYQQYGVRALASLGRVEEALRHAEVCRATLNTSGAQVDAVCEEILLSFGLKDEAYQQYAIGANQGTTYLSTFRAIAKKYSHIQPSRILVDLVNSTPGQEGKWFATAKEIGQLDFALKLAESSPCAPDTLNRAASDFVETNPRFALGAALCSLHWIAQGYGYEVTSSDVYKAYQNALYAADRLQETEQVLDILKKRYMQGNNFVTQVLARELGS
ncbi:MAG: hypothetical protein K2X27_22290 [Candidatus Obscuribacterales bacterium]|nr:hypothetical protein [Candidatus Obscuribacterales bacterium]